MTGIDSILDKIKADCDSQIDKIRNDALSAKNEIDENAKAQAKKNADLIAQRSQGAAAKEISIAESAASLTIRNEMLKCRRAEIAKTLDMAVEAILNLPDDEYFDFLYSIAAKMENCSGEIMLNDKDRKRIPSDFNQKMKAAGIDGTLSEKTVSINGGFILRRGDIEENADISVIFRDNADSLEDTVNVNLFKEEQN